eukprot:GFUD01085523.1.p1 GENE.GFUD01085523.1~~GFUD01085523.1.p1  ORF type:complete len:945 (+),score=222.25 GFUD01085523.1:241-3075(+)
MLEGAELLNNGELNKQGLEMTESIYFTDVEKGEENKLVDFVLVWEEKPSDPQWSVNKTKREIFLQNLEAEGLELESEECGGGNALRFIKIHAPMEVLRRYAEILKIRMPIKNHFSLKWKFSADMLHSESAEGAEMLEFKLTQLDGTTKEQVGSMIRIPLFSDVHDELKSWFEKFQEPFYPSEAIFNRSNSQFTAVYSRDKDYLFNHNDSKFFSPATRSGILEFLLKRKRFSEDPEDDFAFGISKLISDGAYLAFYPLHDGGIHTEGSQRKLLYDEWASLKKFWKYQPLDAVRDYYGVKMGLYFAWLGYYTFMLIPPSIVGIFCFLYGVLTYSTDIPIKEICDGAMGNTTMCPICDEFCDFWSLRDSCKMTQAKYFFDNGTTVFFAVFMSLWAVIFLEFWKRYSAEITHRWDVFGYDPEEEHPRPEYLVELRDVEERTINFITQTSEPKPPFWKMKLPGILISWTSVMMFVMLALITVIAIILYRMSMVAALAAVNDSTIKSNWSLFISMTGAAINLVLILIFNYIYEFLAIWLTEKELHRTQTGFDNALTLKIYLFQFVNYYASIFYIAFVKGQFVGTPNEYTRFMSWRQEECSPGGCFIELCIQLAIIFMGKQFMLSVMEYYMPLMWKVFNLVKLAGWKNEETGKEEVTPQYIKDFKLVEWGHQGLFYEYLEMVLQYGFITIFVCAFPLAPFFAFCNNVLELRLDAKKILVQHRRPIAQKVQSIGVWMDIMETLGRISIITNAFIIALTSEFIPKAVYRGFYSQDGSLTGYVNYTLSYFDPMDIDRTSHVNLTLAPELCRYPDYKFAPWEADKYTNNAQFWHIWFARLLFVVIFENLVACTIMAMRLAIPDISSNLKYRIRREAYITKEIIIRTERLKKDGKVRGKSGSAPVLNSPDLRTEGETSFTQRRNAGGDGVSGGGGLERSSSTGDVQLILKDEEGQA